MAHHFSEPADLDARFHNFARGSAFGLQAFRRDGKFRYGSSLLSLLEFTRNTKSTDPRDKVYAPHGLATDLLLTSVLPDYSKSVESVYADVVQFSLSQPDHGLQVLGQIIRPTTDWSRMKNTYNGPKLPSWMPNFCDRLGLSPFCPNVKDSNPAYNACGLRKTRNARIEDARLILDGMKLDEISTLSATWEENIFSTAEVRSWAPKHLDAV